MSMDTPDASTMPYLPPLPDKPPTFGERPGKKPKAKSSQPTFLGTAAMPTAQQIGSKTFLGM